MEPCGKTQTASFGWVSPFDDENPLLIHAANGFLRLKFRKCEKVLPASVINDTLKDRLRALANLEGRELSKKERLRLKDEVTYDLLPKAFVRKVDTSAYIDTVNQWVVVDASSRTAAEGVISLLRDTLGTLTLQPLELKSIPSALMTEWLKTGKINQDFTMDAYCLMQDPKTGMGLVRCDKQDLLASEVQAHLKAGKQVMQLALTWEDKLSFVLDHEFSVRRIRFLEILSDAREALEAPDPMAQMDVDFALMTAEFTRCLRALITLFGGWREETKPKNTVQKVVETLETV